MSGRICQDCGRVMRRSRRRVLEHLFHAAAFRCEQCGARQKISHWKKLKNAKYAQCPRCGRRDLRVLTKRDRIDFFYRSIFRRFQALLGARLYHCWSCRLQFYDVRRRTPDQELNRANGLSSVTYKRKFVLQKTDQNPGA